MVRGYTTIEQSKKLAKILPLESSDMWHHGFFTPRRMCKIEYNPPAPYHSVTPQWDCPCWSLAALLSVLPEKYTKLLIKEGGMYRILIKDLCMTSLFDNPVDACVAMIEKLHELNLL